MPVVTDPLPTLVTPRLTLRAYLPSDAEAVSRMAGAREVATHTATIPHPYPVEEAHAWVTARAQMWHDGAAANWAIVHQDHGLIGGVGLVLEFEHERAELGYWIGVPFWGQGFASEAAAAVLQCGFTRLSLARIYAVHQGSNPASGKVLRKLGMTLEGRSRSHVVKWDRREDLVLYGILAAEWRTTRKAAPEDVQLRLGLPSDAAALASLAESTFRDAFAADNTPEDMAAHCVKAYGPAQQLAELQDPRMSTIVAVQGTRLVAFAQLRDAAGPACVPTDQPILELQRFYVSREWHSRGLAQQLMQRVFDVARERKSARVWLGVFQLNVRAIAFYRKMGFSEIGSHVFVLGSDPQQDHIMLRTL
jgi:RimJ/RimL family protein N-acetyltransferase